MKRKKGFMFKISFILLIVFTQYQNILSQTPNFFPLAIGNEYQLYNGYNYFYGKIERDTIYPNGKQYFHLPVGIFEFGDCRVDSSGNILSASRPFFGGEPEEQLVFKADAQLNEVWTIAWNINPLGHKGYGRCIYVDSGYIFGKTRKIKGVLLFSDSYYYYYYWLAEDIGLIKDRYDNGTISILNYAKINGVEYGTLVSVNNDDAVLQMDFSVSQNYPNPFNGITNINVRQPINFPNHKIKLTIHNILGSKLYEREYAVNNNNFIISFNTDELHLSSGTYFYSVSAGEKSITKKFLLIK